MHPLTSAVREGLGRAADPAKAGPMAAYMKRVQPFLGVQTPLRARIVREARARAPLEDRAAYDLVVRELWRGEFREERYAALDVAALERRFLNLPALPLLEELLGEADHWDVLDPLATGLLGRVLRGRPELRERARIWNASPHLWTRRAAVLVQLGYKGETDAELLEEVLASRLHETEFFVRKAVGWALREYAKTDPGWVRGFVAGREGEISALSRREALKHLGRAGAGSAGWSR